MHQYILVEAWRDVEYTKIFGTAQLIEDFGNVGQWIRQSSFRSSNQLSCTSVCFLLSLFRYNPKKGVIKKETWLFSRKFPICLFIFSLWTRGYQYCLVCTGMSSTVVILWTVVYISSPTLNRVTDGGFMILYPKIEDGAWYNWYYYVSREAKGFSFPAIGLFKLRNLCSRSH